MKKALFTLAALFCLSVFAEAQYYDYSDIDDSKTDGFILKMGVGTSSAKPKTAFMTQGNGDAITESLELSVADAGKNVHLGVAYRLRFNNFTIQPELVFNSTKREFLVKTQGMLEAKKEDEISRHLDVPLLFGVKYGFFRAAAGPVAAINLGSSSDLSDYDGYQNLSEDVTYGWQAGVGVDVWKITLDARYEGFFNDYGEHISFGGETADFDANKGRFLVSLGLAF